MKITYGKAGEFNLGFLFYIGVFCILLTDPMLIEIMMGKAGEEGENYFPFEKYLGPVAILVSLFFFNRYSPYIRKLLFFTTAFLLFLVAESLLTYNSYFVYPHVFSKLIYFYIFFFAYLFIRPDDEKDLRFLAYAICVVFLVDLFMHKREILSLSSFLDTKRGFNAESVFLLLVPCLFFFNKFFQSRSLVYLALFFANLGIIVFLQHRSVWIATGIALTINLFLLKKAAFQRSSQSYTFLFITPLAGIFLLLTFLVTTAPDFIAKLSERANDIVNFETEGTGSWRHEQFMSYLPFIKDNFFVGMRFEGFELPIQFYNIDAGIPFFNDGTGHHFHSFYVDTLFYFGFVGLLLKIAPYFYLLYKIYKEKELTVAQLALSTFAFSALFYGISYWWPAFFYGIFGFTLAIFDNKESTIEEPTEEIPQSFSIPQSLKKEYI